MTYSMQKNDDGKGMVNYDVFFLDKISPEVQIVPCVKPFQSTFLGKRRVAVITSNSPYIGYDLQ